MLNLTFLLLRFYSCSVHFLPNLTTFLIPCQTPRNLSRQCVCLAIFCLYSLKVQHAYYVTASQNLFLNECRLCCFAWFLLSSIVVTTHRKLRNYSLPITSNANVPERMLNQNFGNGHSICGSSNMRDTCALFTFRRYRAHCDVMSENIVFPFTKISSHLKL